MANYATQQQELWLTPYTKLVFGQPPPIGQHGKWQ
jgi:hypothetical protein